MATVTISLEFQGDPEAARPRLNGHRAHECVERMKTFPQHFEAVAGVIFDPETFAPVRHLSATTDHWDSNPKDRAILMFFNTGLEEHDNLVIGRRQWPVEHYEALSDLLDINGVEWKWEGQIHISSALSQTWQVACQMKDGGLEWEVKVESDWDDAAESDWDDTADEVWFDPDEVAQWEVPNQDAGELILRPGVSRELIEEGLFGTWEDVQNIRLGDNAVLADGTYVAEAGEPDEPFHGQPYVEVNGLAYPLTLFVERGDESADSAPAGTESQASRKVVVICEDQDLGALVAYQLMKSLSEGNAPSPEITAFANTSTAVQQLPDGIPGLIVCELASSSQEAEAQLEHLATISDEFSASNVVFFGLPEARQVLKGRDLMTEVPFLDKPFDRLELLETCIPIFTRGQ